VGDGPSRSGVRGPPLAVVRPCRGGIGARSRMMGDALHGIRSEICVGRNDTPLLPVLSAVELPQRLYSAAGMQWNRGDGSWMVQPMTFLLPSH